MDSVPMLPVDPALHTLYMQHPVGKAAGLNAPHNEKNTTTSIITSSTEPSPPSLATLLIN